MRKKRKNSIKTSLIVVASCFVLLLPFSCQEKPDAISKNELQIENNEFFVGENSVKMVAENFAKGFGSNTPNSLKTQKTYSLNKFLDEENGEALLYIVNYDDGGFLIIPADNRVFPILAQSETSSFGTEESELPGGINIWVQDIKKVIKKIKKENKEQSKEVKLAWEKYLRYSQLKVYIPPDPCEDQTIIVGPLLNTTWGQECGYNSLLQTETQLGCSSLPCDKAYTGCIATAMAQVMKYHQYPSSYSWSSMPNNEGTTATATLMYDIGQSIDNYNYSCTGSGVSYENLGNVVLSLENDFNYSTSVTLSNYSSYSFSTVTNEINYNRPVIFVGTDTNTNTAHSWVCDGYQSRFYCDTGGTYLYSHLNWGEDGDYDGYFGYNFNFTKGSNVYDSNVKMITGIKP